MAVIKSYVTPPRLYRYRSLRHGITRELDAIREGYLYCSAYVDLNDPMEGSFSSTRLLRKSETYRQIKAAVMNNKSEIGMCSFSEVCNHELMWAHYANQFKGICIGYSFNRLLKALRPDVEFVRMFYNETVPTISHNPHDSMLLAKKVLSYKNYRWLYEREWRMFGSRGAVHYSEISCATHVYLGSRMETEAKRQIISELRPLGIKVSVMTIEKYKISFTPTHHITLELTQGG